MNLSFYRHRYTFDFLPSISLNIISSEKLHLRAYALLISFMEWTLDIQWERKI